ncbi:MAG: ABC transporter permease [Bacilli bacterium]|nr:ABC transporter permease [Acholeplasmataceae bacterium]MDY2902058.1 ABC transporter permease [Bacilli bacterium]
MVKKIIGKSYLALILLLMYAPILLLVVFSFTNSTLVGTWNGFSLELYKQMFKNEEIMEALKNTIIIAVVSSLCSTLLGTIGAIGIFYSKDRAKKVINGLNQIPVMNAEIVTAISLTILFVALGIEFNFVTLLIGHMVITIPFVVLSVLPKLQQLDPNTYEAALDLGASPKKALWSVIIPEIMPGIISGFLLCITLSLDDYIITAFTRNNSFSTLSTYIYGVTAKRGALPATLRALSTLITVVMLIVLIIINVRSKKNNVKVKRGVRIK